MSGFCPEEWASEGRLWLTPWATCLSPILSQRGAESKGLQSSLSVTQSRPLTFLLRSGLLRRLGGGKGGGSGGGRRMAGQWKDAEETARAWGRARGGKKGCRAPSRSWLRHQIPARWLGGWGQGTAPLL